MESLYLDEVQVHLSDLEDGWSGMAKGEDDEGAESEAGLCGDDARTPSSLLDVQQQALQQDAYAAQWLGETGWSQEQGVGVGEPAGATFGGENSDWLLPEGSSKRIALDVDQSSLLDTTPVLRDGSDAVEGLELSLRVQQDGTLATAQTMQSAQARGKGSSENEAEQVIEQWFDIVEETKYDPLTGCMSALGATAAERTASAAAAPAAAPVRDGAASEKSMGSSLTGSEHVHNDHHVQQGADPEAAALSSASKRQRSGAKSSSAVEAAKQEAERFAIDQLDDRKVVWSKKRRLEKGDDSADEDEKLSDIDLTALAPEQAKSVKYRQRLQKNRDSAYVSRIRRRVYTKILEDALSKHELENVRLRDQMRRMEEQMRSLQNVTHSGTSSSTGPVQSNPVSEGDYEPLRHNHVTVNMLTDVVHDPCTRSGRSNGTGALFPVDMSSDDKKLLDMDTSFSSSEDSLLHMAGASAPMLILILLFTLVLPGMMRDSVHSTTGSGLLARAASASDSISQDEARIWHFGDWRGHGDGTPSILDKVRVAERFYSFEEPSLFGTKEMRPLAPLLGREGMEQSGGINEDSDVAARSPASLFLMVMYGLAEQVSAASTLLGTFLRRRLSSMLPSSLCALLRCRNM
ncbi:hypothetical protein FVE85_6168 [Porphyridium purpureum]|uniref:BZIP domain-containing protein n=1 Tax=Porphyridium purpureum TaxID=35688 RepID=A0A5J4Z6V4_PORPP|nr:hypothetical protein FVE85_6168 [Porphyridium purpureum]|eukprot:POR0198..scf295_1